ncbi:hypothetical protein [Brumicola pallidula]|jgi:penicillin-binding protein 1C|uniref:Uncharacterized protein n=1 Tax=Brumicola pallidula DSM 14239 = ACAM 615 TaxID=1121922 RepID=K6Z9K8_9ALTE|nr:hypothetical protein [Glaciecola pallidula]GAC27072.1 hypothetical protein GPAL_0191 [Glaciecola pallidula DSM 14239 = ACAM 615]
MAKQKIYAFWPTEFQSLFAQAGVHIEKPPRFMPNCGFDDIVAEGNKPQIISPQSLLN